MTYGLDRRLFLKSTGALAFAACGMGTSHSLFAAEKPSSADVAQKNLAAEKLGWRLGCCAYSFNHLTFFETVDKVASLGLKTVVGFNWQKLAPNKPDAVFSENMSAADLKETQKHLSDAGVKVACCYCGGLAEEAATRRLFEFAKTIGIETIDGEPPHEAFDMLEKLCDEYKINLAVHNHAKPTPNWEPETLLKLFEGRSKRIGACCDTGHWARSGLNPVETLKLLQGRILTFDLKDVDENGICVPFGTGKGDIRGILTELHRQQFHGVFGIEYDNRTEHLEDDLAQCITFFNNTAEKLAVPQ
jgi:sugar phosphate isomerase/epimerase